jgi:hypothetical protein
LAPHSWRLTHGVLPFLALRDAMVSHWVSIIFDLDQIDLDGFASRTDIAPTPALKVQVRISRR